MAQLQEKLSNEELGIRSKEELIELINLLYCKIEANPKTSESQLKAMKNYYSKKSSSVCETQKKYYERMKQNPEWVEKKIKLVLKDIIKKNYLCKTLFRK